MKTRSFLPFLTALALLLSSIPLFSQRESMESDSTGLPGDNFSLEAAIELFKKSASPEDFEKRLNSENNDVNNLDLNGDGEIDYIRVIDNMEGDVHAIVLQVAVSETESQDVAVIEIEKQGADNAILQIVGDEDLYGKEKIAEPFEEEKVKSGREKGPAPQIAPVRIVVNVWFWSPVRFLYAPAYHPWVSPWHWRAYPTWWRPYRPSPWHAYHVRVMPYRAHYQVVTTHRVVRAHAVYAPHRAQSKIVHTRTTTVVAARGKHGAVVGKKTTTTTRNNGRVKGPKTTTTTHKNERVKGTKTTTKTGARVRNGNTAVKKTPTKTPRGRKH